MNNAEEKTYFVSLEAKVAAIATEVRIHHEMVKEGFDRLYLSYKERDQSTRDDITILTQTVRTVSEWQIGHANSIYHKDLFDRVAELEGTLEAIKELHVEKWFKDSTEDRNQIRLKATALNNRVIAIEQERRDEDVARKASSTLLKRQTAVLSFLLGLAGSAVGIIVALNII